MVLCRVICILSHLTVPLFFYFRFATFFGRRYFLGQCLLCSRTRYVGISSALPCTCPLSSPLLSSRTCSATLSLRTSSQYSIRHIFFWCSLPDNQSVCETDDKGNALFQSYLSKLFEKDIGWRYCRTAARGRTGKKMFVFYWLFVHAAVRGGTCAFTLKVVNTLIKNSSRDDRPSISTCKRPMANPVRVGQGR